jgi:hypothetical protein
MDNDYVKDNDYVNDNHYNLNINESIFNNNNNKNQEFLNNNFNCKKIESKNKNLTLYQSPSKTESRNININNNIYINCGKNIDIGYFNNNPKDNPNLNLQQKLNIGPNVNIKFPKNINRSSEQKEFFFKKICKTKKTELCKNWELYSDCFYKDKCSFAHGEFELRNKILAKNDDYEKYKTKPCRSFDEKGYCSFGNRCQYTHILSKNRLLSYKAINSKLANGILTEAMKSDNEQIEFMQILINAKMNSLGHLIM